MPQIKLKNGETSQWYGLCTLYQDGLPITIIIIPEKYLLTVYSGKEISICIMYEPAPCNNLDKTFDDYLLEFAEMNGFSCNEKTTFFQCQNSCEPVIV